MALSRMTPVPALLLLSSAGSPGVPALMRALVARWDLSHEIPGALARYRREEDVTALLRRQAARAGLVLHLSPDGGPALAGTDGLVEVYAPAEPALCRLSPAERLDPLAWEALWRRERDLARRAALVVVPSAEAALVMRLLYGVPPARLRQAPPEALPGLLPLAFTPSPDRVTTPFTLALNDYPVLERHTGGAVRVRQGLAALGGETLLLSLGNAGATAAIGPGLLQVSVPKRQDQRALEADLLTLTGQALEDIASAMHAPDHVGLTALAADLAGRAQVAIFEHCYLAPLLDAMDAAAPALPVVYDAHNVETLLKRELLQAHPAREALCGFVDEVEHRLLDRAALVLACSEGDAAFFRPHARQVVMMPHGVPPAPAAPVLPAEGAAPRIGFVGSAHPPNAAAAQFIARELAPRFPELVFEFIGGICNAVEAPGPNIRLLGTLSEGAKSEALQGWTLALNPVESGGGASLKVADYLAHGLPSLNTPHAARGFPLLREGAGLVLPLSEFAPALQCLLCQPQRLRQMARAARDAGAAQSWPEVARTARQALGGFRASGGAATPPAPMLARDLATAQAARPRAGAARLDLLAADDRLWPLADRNIAPLPLPWPEASAATSRGEEACPPPRPISLALPPETRRLALELRAEAPLVLRWLLRLGPDTRALLRTRLEGSCRLEINLPPHDAPAPRLEAELLSGSAAALHLRAVQQWKPEFRPLALPAARGRMAPSRQEAGVQDWLARHARAYAPLPERNPQDLVEETVSLLLQQAASVRRMGALRASLGLTQPFLLLLGQPEPEPEAAAGLALVRHDGTEASLRDADGVQRRITLPVAGLILPRWPACQGIRLGRLPPAWPEAVRQIAAWAGVPVTETQGTGV